ncbi:MAG: VWA domain-containing protein [Planctomycetota bacterium]|jgi:HEAT repeat protein
MRVVVSVLLLAVAAHADGAQAVLTWKVGTVRGRHPLRLPLDAKVPPGVVPPAIPKVEVPEGQDQPGPPLYAQLPFGDLAKLTLAVTPLKLVVDGNLDGDLFKETVQDWARTGGVLHRTVHLAVPFAAEPEPVEVPVLVTYRPDAKPPRIELAARAYRIGTVVLAGRERKVALVDATGDLRYDKPDEDRLFFDLDGNGKLRLSETSHEELRADLPFQLAGRGFVARTPDLGGRIVRFEPVDETPPPPRRPWVARVRPTAGRGAPRRGNLEALAARYNESAEQNRPGWSRRGIVYSIGQVGSREAFALLMRVYQRDDDAEVRDVAVAAMGYAQYVAHASQLEKIANKNKRVTTRVAAIKALHDMGAPDRAKLYARLLNAKDEPVAAAAAAHLAYVGSAAAREALVDAATRSPRARNRYHCYLYGTRYTGTPPDLELMTAASKAPDERLAALGLQDLHYFLRPEARELALAAARDRVQGIGLALVLVEILASAGDAQAVATVLPFADRDSETLRGRLVDLLRPVRDPGGLEVVAKGLASRVPEVRRICIRVLAGIPTPASTAALAAQLGRERDEAVATELIRALARHGGAAGGEAIANAARRFERHEAMRGTILRALADIGLENEAVRGYFEKKLEAAKWEERVLAIDAAARAKAAALAPKIVACLDHRAWQVRLAAIQAFRLIRVKEAIGPLIGRLGSDQEKERRLRRAIGETLAMLTGENYFTDFELWARWWRGARGRFKVPDVVKPKKRTGTKTVARFYGLPVDSERVVFVIDQSGSMSSRNGDKTDYEKAVEEVLKVAKRLGRRAKINVIMFESDVHPWKKGLVSVTEQSRRALAKYLNNLGPTGGTNLYDGLELALNHAGCDTIFLLSDGAPTAGKYVNDLDIVREARRINELKRITIHTVSLGRESSLLRQLADEHGGRYVRR